MTENYIYRIEHELLNDIEFWGISDDEKIKTLLYICGIHDACSYIVSKMKEGKNG